MYIKITHPMADTVSVIDNDGLATPLRAQAGEGSCELAFFMNGAWVIDTIPEFADYADSYGGDTSIYCYVPNEILEDFLSEFAVRV